MEQYARLMTILGGLRHIQETGTIPDNRSEVDAACQAVLRFAPSNSAAQEWREVTKGRRRNPRPLRKSG